MTLSELETRMTNIVNRRVKAWKTDYTEYDAPQVREINAAGVPMSFVWIVRECGTWIVMLGFDDSMQRVQDIEEHYNTFAEYTVTFDGSGVWKIKKTGGKSAA